MAFGVALLQGCSTPPIAPPNIGIPDNIICLGHKGSGTYLTFGNLFRDNSIPGIVHAIDQLDGTEFDVQMSRDSTLWLFHDHVMLNCNGDLENIAALSDSLVNVYSACNYGGEIARLADLTTYVSKHNFPEKTISIDLKVLQNPVWLSRFQDKKELARLVAKRLQKMFQVSQTPTIFIEVPFKEQIAVMEEITGYTTFLIHNSFEYLRDGDRFNHSAPIHHYYQDVPGLFQSYGQLSLVWVVNSADDLMNAIELNPTAIQTDNIPMIRFFELVNQKCEAVEKKLYPREKLQSEYFTLEEHFAPVNRDILYEIDFGDNQLAETQIVFSAVNKNSESTKWMSTPIYKNKHFFFIGKDEHAHLNTYGFSIYLWQNDGKPIVFNHPITLRNYTLTD